MRNGFTLLEMAIVLVVISTVITGILVGKDLIELAETRSIMSQLNSYQVAVTAFKSKYDCKPGDCKKAAAYGLPTSPSGWNGDGDGLIGGSTWPSGCLFNYTDDCVHNKRETSGQLNAINRAHGEHQIFWAQLSSAKLIKETIVANPSGTADRNGDQLAPYFPKLKNGRGYLVAFSWNNKTFIRTGVNMVWNGGAMSFQVPALKPSQVRHIMRSVQNDDTVYIQPAYEYPMPMDKNQRVFPVSVFTDTPNGNNGFIWRGPSVYNANGEGTCADAATGTFSTKNAYLCNILWQIDY